MSSIGAMFAPRHQAVADKLVRVCRPGGTIGMLNWTPEGMIGALFKTMGPSPAARPGAQPTPLWGGEDHVRELFGDRVEWRMLERDNLDINAFENPHDYGEHFKARYGPTIVARATPPSRGAKRAGRGARQLQRRVESRQRRRRALRAGVPGGRRHTRRGRPPSLTPFPPPPLLPSLSPPLSPSSPPPPPPPLPPLLPLSPPPLPPSPLSPSPLPPPLR